MTQYVLNKFSKNFPPYHATQDDVSIPLQRLEVENTTGHQSLPGRGSVIAVMCGTHRTGFYRTGNGKWTFSSLATEVCATGPAPRTRTAKSIACTAGFEMARHNGSFLGVTASGSWHTTMAVYCMPIGFADTAKPCFSTGPTFGARATTVGGGSGKSARLHRRMECLWFDFWMTPQNQNQPTEWAVHIPPCERKNELDRPRTA